MPAVEKKRKQISAHVRPEFLKALKVLSAELERTQLSCITEALNDFFEKHNKPRINDERLP